MLFDHCAVCRQCCTIEEGYPPLEITLTAREEKRFIPSASRLIAPISVRKGARWVMRSPSHVRFTPCLTIPNQMVSVLIAIVR